MCDSPSLASANEGDDLFVEIVPLSVDDLIDSVTDGTALVRSVRLSIKGDMPREAEYSLFGLGIGKRMEEAGEPAR